MLVPSDGWWLNHALARLAPVGCVAWVLVVVVHGVLRGPVFGLHVMDVKRRWTVERNANGSVKLFGKAQVVDAQARTQPHKVSRRVVSQKKVDRREEKPIAKGFHLNLQERVAVLDLGDTFARIVRWYRGVRQVLNVPRADLRIECML